MNWISVNERLPEIDAPVIVFSNGVVQQETCRLHEACGHRYYFWVTNHIDCANEVYMLDHDHYWMPLPEPPEDSE